MKDKTGGLAIKKFIGLKPKMYSLLVDNSEHRRAKGMNKKVVPTISHNECKDVLFNNKFVGHTVIRIGSKNHRIGTYEIKKTSLSCSDNKIYIQNNGYDG